MNIQICNKIRKVFFKSVASDEFPNKYDNIENKINRFKYQICFFQKHIKTLTLKTARFHISVFWCHKHLT